MTTEAQSAPETANDATPTSTETKNPVTAETETDDAAPPADTPDGSNPENAPEKPKGDHDGGVQKKINKLTARAKAAEAERDRILAEREAERSRTVTPPAASEATKPPRVEDFNSYDDYETAKDKYVIDLAVKRVKDEQAQAERAKSADAEAARKRDAGQKFRDAVEAAADRYEDLDEAVEAFHKGGVPINVTMLEYVYEHAETENKAALVHHLYANQEAADRISKLSPLAAARELARLETTLAKPQPRVVSNAPKPPVVPKGGAEPPARDYESMSMAEYAALRRQQDSAAFARRMKG
jgi:hypothetical protein